MPEGSSWIEFQRRALTVFEALLPHSAEERSRRLADECGGDPALESAVRRLLERDEIGESCLDLPFELPSEPFYEPSWIGRRIGPFALRQRLGEGGAGVVYLAERVEGNFPQRVAVKLVHTHVDAREAARRFQAESRILASLSHPNIAQLLDGGTTDDGVPYVVMEAVDGLPITEYCDRHRLDLPARLRVFRKVCDAVHFAHGHLVVHRDLKPSNILVTHDGEPKLLDFGISKLLAASEGDDRTRTELRALTPAYASPEQLAGRPVTTVSDVYSLGILLYELLCGLRPYDAGMDTPEELAERLERATPPPPSAAVGEALPAEVSELAARRGLSGGDLARRLHGDLDEIVAKAMFSDAEGRYGSVQALADDIARFLDGRPVTARPPRLGYRLGKLARRNRWAAALGALAVAVIVALAGLAAVRSIELRRERDAARAAEAAARREQRRSEEVTRFLQDAFTLADPGETRGAEVTAREILDAGAERIRQGTVSEPELRATLLETLADVYIGLGRYDAAGPLAEEAVSLRRGESEPSALARSLEILGVTRLYQQEFAAAEPPIRESLALRRAAEGPSSLAVASSLFYLAYLHAWQGRPEQAEAAVRRALAIRRRHASGPTVEVADAWYLLAQIGRGRHDAAELGRYYRRALETYRDLGAGHERRALICLQGLGKLLAADGRTAEAEHILTEAVEGSRALLGEHPLVADFLVSRASLYRQERRWEEAESDLREALRTYRAAGGESDDLVVAGLVHLGNLLLEKGDLAAAEGPLREAWQQSREALRPDDLRRGSILNNLTMVLLRKGELEEAGGLCRESLPLRRRQLASGEGSISALEGGLANTLTLCADVLIRQGRSEQALPLAEEAHATYVEQGPEWRLAVARSVLGAALAAGGEDAERAEELLTSGYEALERLRPGSEYAAEARDRLTVLRSLPTAG